MQIEAVDFSTSMPEVDDIGDGSQDALLVRVAAGGACRLGRVRGGAAGLDRQLRLPDVARRLQAGAATRCSARRSTAPPTSRASATWCAPTARWTCCRPTTPSPASRWRCGTCSASARRAGVEAARLQHGLSEDALRLAAVRRHAAGDAGEGAARARDGLPRREVRLGAVSAAARVEDDADQLAAAREGLGDGRHPAGRCRHRSGATMSSARRSACRRSKPARATWLEEPFVSGALERLPARWRGEAATVKLAGGEGAHNYRHGPAHDRLRRRRLHPDRLPAASAASAPAKQVADYARATRRDLRQPHLHLAPGAVAPRCSPSPAWRITRSANTRRAQTAGDRDDGQSPARRDANGQIAAPDAPGLGIAVSASGARKYLQDVDIRVNGRRLFATAEL